MSVANGRGPATLADLLINRIAATGDEPAYRHYDGARWRTWNWHAAGREVARARAAFAASGLRRGDRVGICAYNAPEWVFCDLAALSAGLVVVPLFFNDRPENIAYCLKDAGVRWLFVDRPPAAEILDCGLQGIVSFKETRGVVSFRDWLAAADGRQVAPADHGPGDLATIVYTSGTTGRPKGVMLTHGNILANVGALLTALPEVAVETHRFLSFLPLSHMLERTVGEYVAIAMGAETVFSRGITELGEDLKIARPTILVSVPKIFERTYGKMQEELKASPRRQRLVARVSALGLAVYEGRARGLERLLARFADALVGRAVRRRLGGKLRYVFLGGAPAAPRLLGFFTGLGLRFVQGYGLTETAPVISCNRLSDRDLASVGRPLANVTVRFVHDEICVKGPSVMSGYWNLPEATAQAVDAEGYFHTGDLGRLEGGLLYLTGRAKDIIVLSNGEKVAPADVEQAILQDPAFEHALVVGEGRGALALLAVSDTADEQQLRDRANDQLHAFPGYTRIRHVLRVSGPWTIENGFLTPTLKVRRQWIEERYAAAIDALYAAPREDAEGRPAR